MKKVSWKFLGCLVGTVVLSPFAQAQQTPKQNLNEPVYRVSKVDNTPAVAEHPLDPALDIARNSLQHIRSTVADYTCVVVKRERIDGVVGDYEYMFAKIRNRKMAGDQIHTPFSVYLSFLKPSSVKGREVLFVENANNGKLFAHEGGMKRMLGTHSLEPSSWLAMKGQRYPVTDLGLESLVEKLIERGERDRRNGDCEVNFMPGAELDGRSCTVFQVKHPEKKAHYDFYVAQVFIDDEYNFPVRYRAFDWPTGGLTEPELIEEYAYKNIKLNVGLTDEDFNVNSSAYNFHKQ